MEVRRELGDGLAPLLIVHRAWSRVLALAEGLYPGYFALVMATGALSIALDLLHHAALAHALFALNVLAYAVLCGLLALRVVRFYRDIAADFVDHARAPGFFTVVAGTCVLGTNFAVAAELPRVAFALWVAGIVLWVLVMYSFFAVVVTRASKPDLEKGINGAWLIAAVATQSVVVLGAVLSPTFASPDGPLFFCLIMYLIGAMLYLSIITLIFYRLTFVRLTGATFTPPYWINMGAVAITTLAGATLVTHVAQSALLERILPFLLGFTLFFWAAATWWIPLLVILMFWRHVIMRYPFRYEPQYWSMAFPLAMYTTGTLRLADALRLDFLAALSRGFVWLAALVWLVCFLGMLHAIVSGWGEAASAAVEGPEGGPDPLR